MSDAATPTITPNTEVKTCGATYKRKVKGGAEKEFTCGKPAGHTPADAHGQVTAKKPAVTLSAGVLDSFEVVPDTEFVALVTRERSADQVKVDGHVKKNHTDWIEAGRPEDWGESPRARYLLPVEEVDGVKELIRNAAKFHNVKAQINQPVKHVSGNMSLQFRVIDLPGSEKTDTPTESEIGWLRRFAEDFELSEEDVDKFVASLSKKEEEPKKEEPKEPKAEEPKTPTPKPPTATGSKTGPKPSEARQAKR